jgi:hypothetical protein
MKVGDSRRGKGIDKLTVCFVPNHYAENKRTKLKKQMQVNKAKEALVPKVEEEENEKGGVRWAAIRTGKGL